MRPSRRAILVGPQARRRDPLFRTLQLRPADLLIGVDGGAQRCLESGLRPTLCVGDWDSVSAAMRRHILKRERHLTLPRDKDRSDLHYALQVAVHFGADEVVALGFCGGRADHHLGVLFELAELAAAKAPPAALRLLDTEEIIHFVSGSMPPLRLTLRKGTRVSVFSLQGEARGVRLSGFEYSLLSGALSPCSQGLSNRASRKAAGVAVRRGVLAVYVASTGRGR